jgi:hypothetical protein
MASDALPPVRVDLGTVGPTTGAAVVWRSSGRLHVTVVVKATFAFVPGAPMTVSIPDEIHRAERHHPSAPAHGSDLAPYLASADVLLTGHACAPEGERVSALTVRLAVFREQALLDKTIHVYGDRAGADPAPFDRMPIVLERAYGGPASSDNPVGTGVEGRSPNLFDPTDPTRPACFGPIPEAFPSRRRLLGKVDRHALDQPIAEIPADFDWTYFQAAPLDQRTKHLQGDEWIVLEGLHPEPRRVQSRLPGARGRARVYGLEGGVEGHPLTLAADTVAIDADELTCSVVWRGSFPVAGEGALAALHVDAGVELEGRPVEWPPAPPPKAPAIAPAPLPVATPPRASFEGTVAVPDEAQAPLAGRRPLPFGAAAGSAPQRPAVPPAPPAPPSRPNFTGTVAAPDAEPSAAPRRPMPFAPSAPKPLPVPPAPAGAGPRPAPPAPVSAAPGASPFHGTVTVPAEAAPSAAPRRPLPFAPAPAGGTPSLPTAPSAPTIAVKPEQPRFTGTVTAAPEEEQQAQGRKPLPFVRGAPPAPPPPEPIPAPAIAYMADAPVPIAPAPMPTAPMPEIAAPAPRPPALTALGIRVYTADERLALDVIAWGLSPSRDCITVIAKVTCDLVPGGPAAVRPRAEPLAPGDRAPFKVRADVVLTGHASAPKGSALEMEAALRFGAGSNAFERRIKVFGDRHWEKKGAATRPSAPAAFDRMPIAYARAFGGPRFDQNPDGIGHPGPMRPGPPPLPNLEDPGDLLRSPKQTRPPACFAAIPPAWKQRWAALGRAREGWCALAEELDYTAFQAAPRPQQLAFLAGDEPFAITGMHPLHAVLEGTLPDLRARCFASWDAGDRFEEVALRLDTAALDADALTVDLIWRGALPVPDERSPGVGELHLLTEEASARGISLAEARAKLLRR